MNRAQFIYNHNKMSKEAFWTRPEVEKLQNMRMIQPQSFKINVENKEFTNLPSLQEQAITNHIETLYFRHKQRYFIEERMFYSCPLSALYSEVMHGNLSIYIPLWKRVDFCIEEAKRSIHRHVFGPQENDLKYFNH